MNDAGEDNDDPIVLYSEGWQRLPDGRRELLIRCKSETQFDDLPRQLCFGKVEFRKGRFDGERGVAIYRPS